jgi:ribonuclease BN (tRNA processing enzyme)
MDLKVPITITDELTEDVIVSKGWLNLASGEIGRVEYEDYDVEAEGAPFESDDYEFTSGTLSNDGKDVEFKIELNRTTGQYSVSANELLEIKVRAAALFAGVQGAALLAQAGLSSDPAKMGRADKPVAPAVKPVPPKPRGGRYH